MAQEEKIYPEGTKKEGEEFTKRKEIKKLVDKLVKKVAEEKTFKAFKDLGYKEKEGHYFVYAKDSEKETDDEKGGGKGTAENKVNVTISYPKKYSGDETAAPLISNMQKVTTFGGKKLVSEIYLNIKDTTLEITYKNTEDSGFHQQSDGPTYAIRKLEKKVTIKNISDSKSFKKDLEDMFEEICKEEAKYLTDTKIGQDDKIEKKQNASTVMENKFNKMTLKSLLEGEFEKTGEEIYRLVLESTKKEEDKKADEPVKVDTKDGEKELLKGDESKEEEGIKEITTAPGGIAGAFGGQTTPTDNPETSAGGAYATVAGTPQRRTINGAPKGQDGEVVADSENNPKEYRVNEEIEKTPYGEMKHKRARMVRENDGTYSVKVEMEPGTLNMPKGMNHPYAMGLHGTEVNSKEELEKTGHGDLNKLNEAYDSKVKLTQKKIVTNQDNEKLGVNKRYIVTEKLNKEEESKRFKQLFECQSFEGIKDTIQSKVVPGKNYDELANQQFATQNSESNLDSTPACGCESGFQLIPKATHSMVVFKLSEADLKLNKAFVKDYFTNKIVPNPQYKSE